jgi:hypothetical protein
VTYAEGATEPALQNDAGQELEDGSAHSLSRDEAAADKAGDHSLAESSSVSGDSDLADPRRAAEEPFDASVEEEEPAEAEEEPAAETAHRSKSRRSRSRRSKSSSRKQEQAAALERERRRQRAVIDIKKKYGKNAIIKGMNLEEGATAMDRNRQIGGHKA